MKKLGMAKAGVIVVVVILLAMLSYGVFSYRSLSVNVVSKSPLKLKILNAFVKIRGVLFIKNYVVIMICLGLMNMILKLEAKKKQLKL